MQGDRQTNHWYSERGGLFRIRLRRVNIWMITNNIVSRCRTRGESQEFIARSRQSTQARDPPWLWNSGETSSEVTKQGYQWPHEKNSWPPKIFEKNNVAPPKNNDLCWCEIINNLRKFHPHSLFRTLTSQCWKGNIKENITIYFVPGLDSFRL